jgi:CHRD domain/IPTL-CTERM motif
MNRFGMKALLQWFALALLCAVTSASAQTTLNAALLGTNEVANGDPDGTGRAAVTINATTGAVSWNIAAFNILTPTLAHIHRGVAGANGGVVFDFSANLNGSGTMTAALATEILGNPAGFYVNIHTSAHPSGAIRGQLGAAALPGPATFLTTLLGSNEVANGDPDGSGAASVTIDPVTGAVSWLFTTANVDTPTLAHIHRAAAGANGPVVFDFAAQLTGTGVMSLALAAEIAANPAGFYVNIHTAAHPGGAVRGNLRLAAPAAASAPVPTLNEWMLFALAGLLAAAVLRKRITR